MTIEIADLVEGEAVKIIGLDEGQFCELKGIDVKPASLTKAISAFANSDGGDLYVGIEEIGVRAAGQARKWRGFSDIEAANGHLQVFETLFPLGVDFRYEFLRCETLPGLVLHAQIAKTQAIAVASNDIPYARRGAQSLPCNDTESRKRLEFLKGITSFETERTNAPAATIVDSDVTDQFIKAVVPKTTGEQWLKKQALLVENKPTVAGILMFADEPQVVLPKRCGIKVYRYKTQEATGSRQTLAFTPETVEGCLYDQIEMAVRRTSEIIEEIPRLGDAQLEAVRYPAETLHEIITNAVLHRDYSIADDVHVRIFDNRVEVESPGRLPAHITVENILSERYARNGAIVRIINKFPNPPNKDVGEGLNTAFEAMHQLGLKAPTIEERDNSVLVRIRHEPLATPEEAIMDYLAEHDTIKNNEARKITHISADHRIKTIFKKMEERGLIEQVPGTRTSNTCYRRKK